MMLHKGNGQKAKRDRAVLINSYHVMVRDFRIPKDRRLDDAGLARLSNEMLYKVNSDLYSQATVKQAKRLAVKMGLLPKTGIKSFFKKQISIIIRSIESTKIILHNRRVWRA